jgi:hypothetical protein
MGADVKRWSPVVGPQAIYAVMVKSEKGEHVLHSDYAALAARVAGLELERDEAVARADMMLGAWNSFSPIKRAGAERLADEVAALIARKVVDSRSPVGDALLDFREPPRTPRADRIADLELANAALTREVEAVKAKHYDLQHAVWHALDDCEERMPEKIIVLHRVDYDNLCTLSPDEHPVNPSALAAADAARGRE